MLAIAFVLPLAKPATALIVVSPATDNFTPPADDPGWHNATTGYNYVYLGDCWAMSAAHKGVPSSGTLTFSTGTYDLIPGQNFLVHNPAGLGYSTETDLRLVRLKADPGLGPLTIASAPPNVSNQVTIVSYASQPMSTPTYWDVDTGPNPDVWTEVPSGAPHDYWGYKATSPGAKMWGTNKIVRASSVFPSEDVLSTVRALVTISGRDVVSVATVFDVSGTADEAQAIGGDSGGSMFRKNGLQWELAGIVDAIMVYDGQQTVWGVYGNGTTYVDLSYYYHADEGSDFDQSISDIIRSHPGYSVVGDINLDGAVIGDGTGAPAVDDLAAFVAGWMYDNHSPEGKGDIVSWQNGDLNLDGKTNVDDFLLMRSALNPSGAGALAAMLGLGGVSSVPEPAAAVLVLIGVAFLLIVRR